MADRLAEAFAEKVHELVRRDYWGYAPDEKLSVDDMLKVKYQVRGWDGSGNRMGMISWEGMLEYQVREQDRDSGGTGSLSCARLGDFSFFASVSTQLTPSHISATQGIRPAPGYPSQPDHTEKRAMWDLMGAEAASGITLTDSLAMFPAASVSGLFFGGHCSQYFAVGKITKEQIAEYAVRKKMPLEEAERWLRTMLSYEP